MFASLITIELGLLLVAAFTAIMVLLLARSAEQLKLMAKPGAHRQHTQETPMVGGLAIYSGLLLGMFLLDNTYVNLLPALFLLCAVGALDDRYSLPSWTRFLAQGAAIYLMIRMTGVQLDTLGYLAPGSEVLLGRWSVAMTIFAAIGVINAVNMSDGHDGLAGSIVMVPLIALLFSGANTGLILISLAAIVGFLFFNVRVFRSRATVFMGDAGSTMLGLLLAFLLIENSQVEGGIWPVTALWLLALPLIDAVAVLIVRPIRGRSPFAADRIHYHHQLIDRGLSVNSTIIIALILQSGLAALGLWARNMRIADHLQLMVFLSLFFVYLLSLIWFTRNKSR